MDISVVIPLYNEEESLSELMEWIDKVMKDNNFDYEVVMVDGLVIAVAMHILLVSCCLGILGQHCIG